MVPKLFLCTTNGLPVLSFRPKHRAFQIASCRSVSSNLIPAVPRTCNSVECSFSGGIFRTALSSPGTKYSTVFSGSFSNVERPGVTLDPAMVRTTLFPSRLLISAVNLKNEHYLSHIIYIQIWKAFIRTLEILWTRHRQLLRM